MDFSNYTDEELQRIAGSNDFSSYSDAELQKIAGIEPQPVGSRVGRFASGLGIGLSNIPAGIMQVGADIFNAPQLSQDLIDIQKRKEARLSQLGGAGEAGAFTGEVAPALALPVGSSLGLLGKMGVIGAQSAALKGLEAKPEQVPLSQRAGEAAQAFGTGAALTGILGKGLPLVGKGITAGAEALTNPMQVLSQKAFKVSPEMEATFAKEGIPATASLLTQSPTMQRFSSILGGNIASAGRLDKATQAAEDTIQGRLADITKGAATPTEAGRIVQEGLSGYVDKFQNTSNKLYDKLNNFIKPTENVSANTTQQFLNNTLQQFSDAPQLQATLASNPALQKVQNLVKDLQQTATSPAGQISYNSLKEYRSQIGSLIKENVIAGKDNALTQQAYAALSNDMRDAVAAKGGAALKQFDKANKFYSEGIQTIQKRLEPYIKKAEPERILNDLINSSKVGETKINTIFKSIPQKDRELVGQAVIAKMTDEATPAVFFNRYNKLDESAKKALFKSELKGSLDNLSKIQNQIAESQKFTNRSRSADNLGNILLLGGATVAGAPITAFTTAAGANISARILTNPNFVKALSKYATKPITPNLVSNFAKDLTNVAKKHPELNDEIKKIIAISASKLGE
jgi:hypothetical protein